jgi:hypothetical protein
MWNTLVVDVEWNKPPKIPIPLFKNKKYKLSYAIKLETSKIVIVALEYKIDLSRLKVIELDNNNKINDMITMSQERNLNSHY